MTEERNEKSGAASEASAHERIVMCDECPVCNKSTGERTGANGNLASYKCSGCSFEYYR